MSKRYSGAYREDLDKVDPPVVEPAEPETPPTSVEEDTWKKRYADLRRHQSAKEEADRAEKDALKRQVAELMTTSVKLPKTEQELEIFYKQYPEGAAFIETIAAKIAQNKVKEVDERVNAQLKDLDVARKETVKERAYQELLRRHPDFEKLITQPAFKEWIEKQPKSIQDSLFENDTDPEWAARTLDLFKLETEQAVVRKVTKKTVPDLGAAAHVGPTNVSSEPTMTGDGKKIWRESEIKALKPHQFTDEIEAEISKAAREGRIMHDVTPTRR